jgi:hypothetical protein
MPHSLHESRKSAGIDACLDCHRVCEEMALGFCLDRGGEHVERTHYALLLNCADICRTAAHFMMADSALHEQVCGVCADVCGACADSCERVGEMSECASACRTCAEKCRAMVTASVAD